MPSLLLRVLKLAHALQRLLLAVSTARNALLQRMISCLPALLSHTLARGWRGRGVAMVATRATAARRGRAETLQHVVERLSGLSNVDREPLSDKHAAVLCALFQDEDGVVRVWLTQRAMHLNSHQGEVCLPGGKRDAEDVDDAATAVREAQEELALPPADVRVLCSLQPFLSKHLYSVVPVVATVPADFSPCPNPDEVGAVFSMPLSSFLDAHAHIHWDLKSRDTPRKVYRVHSFDYAGHVVWGLTASIMIHVAELALGRSAAFEVEPPLLGTSRAARVK